MAVLLPEALCVVVAVVVVVGVLVAEDEGDTRAGEGETVMVPTSALLAVRVVLVVLVEDGEVTVVGEVEEVTEGEDEPLRETK